MRKTWTVSDLVAFYGRYSSDLQNDNSNAQQRDECDKLAARNAHVIDSEHVYLDEGVSGTKLSRTGLNAMLAAAAASKFGVLYLYSLSRLARESVITMPLLKRLVSKYKVRVICLQEGIDTDRQNWEMLAHMVAMQHERFISDLSAGVRRGQADNVRRGYSVGDYPFGYETVPIHTSEASSRRRKVPRDYRIKADEADWVRRIFEWFVVERQSITWIVRELNRLNAPKDHRSTTPTWRDAYVRRILKNQKYIGLWLWGTAKNVRDPETGKIHQEERPGHETEEWLRQRPDLQLIDEATFTAAQKILAENAVNRTGRRGHDGKIEGSVAGPSGRNPAHLLAGLLVCGPCGRRLYVGGANGRYFFCPGYREGTCSCKTTLQRKRAERLVIEAIRRRLNLDKEWTDAVYNATVVAWERLNSSLPGELASIKIQLTDANKKVENLLDLLERGAGPEVSKRLDQRRQMIHDLQSRLRELESKQPDLRTEPTRESVAAQIEALTDVLDKPEPAAAYALRQLVAGAITVYEVSHPGRVRNYLRGTLKLRIRSLVEVDELQQHVEEAIDFREPDALPEQAERAKSLLDQGRTNLEVAAELGCSKSKLHRLLKLWSQLHDQPIPGLKERRKGKDPKPRMHQRIADEVMELMAGGMLLNDVAQHLGCARDTVTAAIRHWHESRGLEVPDGHSRRKTLDRKSREASDEESNNAA